VISLEHAQRYRFLIMEQSSCPVAVEIFQERTAISAPNLPRERELNLAHEQRYSFLIMEQCTGSLAEEIFPGKHCDFSTYLPKRARAQSGACAEMQFPDYGTGLWSSVCKICSRKALRFQQKSCQESERLVWRMCRGASSVIWNRAEVPC
jgi:hypothetical protein